MHKPPSGTMLGIARSPCARAMPARTTAGVRAVQARTEISARRGGCMQEVANEPRLLLPVLEPFYRRAIPLSWLVIRIAVGWNLVVHAWGKIQLGPTRMAPAFAKPQWEFPRLCRGGSKSLTYPAVDIAAPSTKLRMVSRVIDGHERLSHTK